ncbi:MAG: hypothetical protein ABIJ20_00385 [Nanoarchaeota archaeon]|nr:hypothetical protein [Nanoarchaeota archaeon]MBU1445154.1 hypothetical protein [Nanoarchaeota archaeon]MBU2406372.1 hypothetical protein [Nanoarchaeota archaeon]MBU2420332.1 hypothetical protein [Nanoarchaeota archaeon]MBU2475599.1 hypothetical protein [Nanoarchaeota archaeon]
MQPLTIEEAEKLKPGDNLYFDPFEVGGFRKRGYAEGSREHLMEYGLKHLKEYVESKFGSGISLSLTEIVIQKVMDEELGEEELDEIEARANYDDFRPKADGLPLEVTVKSVEVHDEFYGWNERWVAILLEGEIGEPQDYRIGDYKGFYHSLFTKSNNS